MKNLKLSTKRLMIRPYVLADFKTWRDGYRNRLPKKNKFDVGQVAEERITKMRFRKNLRFHEKARKKDRLYVFGVFDRKNRRHIGFMDIIFYLALIFSMQILATPSIISTGEMDTLKRP